MRLLAIMLLMAVTLVCHAETDTTAKPWDVAQLMQRMAQIKSARAHFVEKKYLKVLSTPLESSGTLFYQAPGRLEKHTLAPKAESLVLDGATLLVESKVYGKHNLTLQDYPAVWAFIESIRSTRAGDLTTLNRFYQLKLEGDAQHWRLALIPSAVKTLEMVQEIRISGRGDKIEEIEIYEAKGERSVMTISEERGDTP